MQSLGNHVVLILMFCEVDEVDVKLSRGTTSEVELHAFVNSG